MFVILILTMLLPLDLIEYLIVVTLFPIKTDQISFLHIMPSDRVNDQIIAIEHFYHAFVLVIYLLDKFEVVVE